MENFRTDYKQDLTSLNLLNIDSHFSPVWCRVYTLDMLRDKSLINMRLRLDFVCKSEGKKFITSFRQSNKFWQVKLRFGIGSSL